MKTIEGDHAATHSIATTTPGRRVLLGALGAAGLAVAFHLRAQGGPAPAAGSQRKPAGPAKSWRLLVNEAVTGESNLFILTARYRPLADYVTGQLRGHQAIDIEPVIDIKRFMSLAQASHKPDLVFGKSVNQLARLVRDSGYQPVVRRADPYQAAFIVAKGSPLRSLPDVAAANARIIMPDEFSATTAVARAELRRQNVQDVQVVHTRYQEAVAQQITNGFGQVGVVNPTIARKWVEQGGRVLAETQPVVNWSVLAASTVPAADVAQLRTSLLAMNTQAPAVMAALGIKEWAAAERQDYLALLNYTKE